MMPLSPDELADIQERGSAVLTRLFTMEATGVAAPVYMGPATQWLVISALQLASRMPMITAGTRNRWVDLAHQLCANFSGDAREILNLGFDEDADLPIPQLDEGGEQGT